MSKSNRKPTGEKKSAKKTGETTPSKKRTKKGALGITDDTPDATADAPDGDCPDDVLLTEQIAANFAEHQIWHRPLTAREIPVDLKLPARDAAFERAMFDRVPGLGKFFGGNDDGSDRGTK